MYKIRDRLYKIEKDDSLNNEANSIINSPLPSDYRYKYDGFYETSDILHRIIEHRNKEINDATRDFIGGRSLNLLVGQTCEFVLDKETEIVIKQLFDREEAIRKIQPRIINDETIAVRVIEEDKWF